MLAIAAAVGALAGPGWWARSKVNGIHERYLRLRDVISGVEAYASDHNSYPFLTSCEALADVLSPKYLVNAPCAEPGGEMQYAYVAPRAYSYVLISPGADGKLEPRSVNLLAATNEGEEAFERAHAAIVPRSVEGSWTWEIDGDIIVTDGEFVSAESRHSLSPRPVAPRSVRETFRFVLTPIAVLAFAAALILRRVDRPA